MTKTPPTEIRRQATACCAEQRLVGKGFHASPAQGWKQRTRGKANTYPRFHSGGFPFTSEIPNTHKKEAATASLSGAVGSCKDTSMIGALSVSTCQGHSKPLSQQVTREISSGCFHSTPNAKLTKLDSTDTYCHATEVRREQPPTEDRSQATACCAEQLQVGKGFHATLAQAGNNTHGAKAMKTWPARATLETRCRREPRLTIY